jgi:hypothetical protein
MKKYNVVILVLLFVVLAAVASKSMRAYTTAKSIAADGSIVAHKWAAGPISWQMFPTQGANVTGNRAQGDVMTAAFTAWTAVVPITVIKGPDTAAAVKANQYDGINVITTNAAPTDLPSGVLAYTYTFYFDSTGQDNLGRTVSFPGQIVEADMAFSPSYTFSLNSAATAAAIDFQAVATHEAGHFLGMDHASDVSSTMFWTTGPALIYPRNLSADDIAGISTLYPPSNFTSTGTLSGTVRTTAGAAVYGAIVVAVDANGAPVASTVTDPSGAYTIQGLAAGSYTVYAEPLSGRMTQANISTLNAIYPSATVNTAFTTRYH